MLLNWISRWRWRRTSRLTDSELSIIRAILPRKDPRAERLFKQALDAPYVTRSLMGKNGYQATIPYVRDGTNCIELDKDIVSPWCVVRLCDARLVKFYVQLLRGGFLRCLMGENVVNEPWPVTWSVEDHILSEIAIPNWLPQPTVSERERAEILRALENWLDLKFGDLDVFDDIQLGVAPGCAEADIQQCEARESMRLPHDYVKFLSISNGITVRKGRPFEIYGTRDLARVTLNVESEPMWRITDLFEAGAVVMRPGGFEASLFLIHNDGDAAEEIDDLRTYVVDSIAMLR